MILLQLRANFGKLHGTLTLHEGLNELCLPNEAGKSTWSAFLLAMLYGIDTRERATRENQNLPAKERYRPWDGSSMEGAIDLIWNGRAVTIERRSQGRTPMGAFRAYETESGTPVPELTAENCGRTLCGAERSVFERTAFVRQLGMAVSSDAQLEQRLSALVTTGEEGPSASALEKKLRDLKNKYTYRTGLLPRLQARRDELQAQLSALRAAQAEAMDLSAACAGAEAARSRLQDLRARIERAQAARRRAGLTELQERETALAARCAALAEQTAGLPDEQMLQLLVRGLEDAAERLQTAQLDAAIGVKLPEKPEDLPGFAGCGPDEAERRAREVQVQWDALHAVRVPKKLSILLPCAAAVLAGAGLCFVSLPIGLGVAGAGLAAFVLSLVLLRRKAAQAERAAEQAEDLLRPFGTDDPAALSGLAARQGEARTQWQQARQAAERQQRLLEKAVTARQAELNDRIGAVARFAPGTQGLSAARSALQEARQTQEAAAAANREREALHRQIEAMADIVGDAPTDAAPDEEALRYDPAEIGRRLEQADETLASLRARLAHKRGQISAQGDAVRIEAELEQLDRRIADAEEANAAVELASEALRRADETLRARFSPQITAEAGHILAELTENKYPRVLLEPDMHLSVREADGQVMRPAAAMSCGTADQMYLALRLAMCRRLLPPDAPMVLDDALVNFDPARTRAALRVLREEPRQILLFTCRPLTQEEE